ncbi:Hypothetical protein SMAX5B_003913 [Scophthalmus maximus]|uniref:Uncharacterized protein n=1 Tax=Scophthalmus maximus TaxID=52904 RepID=A0A2U9AVC6_SCOMX|nr:Hypothetical protein SMAX5B_003913 [Scophthalmus maximus]
MFCSRERAALRTRALRGLVSAVIREQPLRNVYGVTFSWCLIGAATCREDDGLLTAGPAHD